MVRGLKSAYVSVEDQIAFSFTNYLSVNLLGIHGHYYNGPRILDSENGFF